MAIITALCGVQLSQPTWMYQDYLGGIPKTLEYAQRVFCLPKKSHYVKITPCSLLTALKIMKNIRNFVITAHPGTRTCWFSTGQALITPYE